MIRALLFVVMFGVTAFGDDVDAASFRLQACVDGMKGYHACPALGADMLPSEPPRDGGVIPGEGNPVASLCAATPQAIINGDSVNGISVAANGCAVFVMENPAGGENFYAETWGDAGDVRLHVKTGDLPTEHEFDCASDVDSVYESCSFPIVGLGEIYIVLTSPSGFTDVSLFASYDEIEVLSDPGPTNGDDQVGGVPPAAPAGSSCLTPSDLHSWATYGAPNDVSAHVVSGVGLCPTSVRYQLVSTVYGDSNGDGSPDYGVAEGPVFKLSANYITRVAITYLAGCSVNLSTTVDTDNRVYGVSLFPAHNFEYGIGGSGFWGYYESQFVPRAAGLPTGVVDPPYAQATPTGYLNPGGVYVADADMFLDGNEVEGQFFMFVNGNDAPSSTCELIVDFFGHD